MDSHVEYKTKLNERTLWSMINTINSRIFPGNEKRIIRHINVILKFWFLEISFVYLQHERYGYD
jgi:hypothetical protein